MKIMITGARGNFPLALIPRLLLNGHSLVLFDIEPTEAPDHCVSIQGDIRDAGLVAWAMQGCDAVVHAVAYHGNRLSSRNDDDFYSVNVTGTHNVLRAMQLHGIHPIVFSSSEVVYGDGMKNRRIMDEEAPCIPTHIYALTKVLGEEMCQFYAREHDFKVAILRYGCFVPANENIAGVGRLNNWLDREDVAQANELALGALLAEDFKCETFVIHCAKPFNGLDWPELETQPETVIERYYPGAVEILTEHGLSVPHIHTQFDISKAVSMLGYDPQHNFDQFLAKLKG